jgi:hypothetical protein
MALLAPHRLVIYAEYVLLRSRKAKFELIKKQLILVREPWNEFYCYTALYMKHEYRARITIPHIPQPLPPLGLIIRDCQLLMQNLSSSKSIP